MGRKLLEESALGITGSFFSDPASVRRRAVLKETIDAFNAADPPDHYHRLANQNLKRWAENRELPWELVQVHPGDWGEVTLALTQRFGTCFAVLNMANAFVPGGAYVEGAVAQEENMFRRTDCHFRIGPDEYDAERDQYRPKKWRPSTENKSKRAGKTSPTSPLQSSPPATAPTTTPRLPMHFDPARGRRHTPNEDPLGGTVLLDGRGT